MTSDTIEYGVPSAISRPLGNSEHIYWLLDKLYSLNFAAYVELDGHLDSDALTQACRVLQHDHPLLRARVKVDLLGNPHFEAVSPKDRPLVPERSDIAAWRDQVAADIQTQFDSIRGPLARVISFEDDGSRSVVAVLFHHTSADGRSGVALLQDLLRRCGESDFSPRPRPALPSAQKLDPINQTFALARRRRELGFWLRKGKSILELAEQIPDFDSRPPTRREIAMIPMTVPASVSRDLLAACRANGTSVHGALGAAQLASLYSEFGDSRGRNMALDSLVDLRERLDGNLSPLDMGLFVATGTTVHRIASPEVSEGGKAFWRLASRVRSELMERVEAGDINLVHNLYPGVRTYLPNSWGAAALQRVVTLQPPSSMLTYIGRVESLDEYVGFKVRALGFACRLCLRTPSV